MSEFTLTGATVTRLRTEAPLLVRVAGAADFAAVQEVEGRVGLPTPYAYVIQGLEDVDESSLEVGQELKFEEGFGVVVGVDNTGDPIGSSGVNSLEAIRTEVLDALHLWEPWSMGLRTRDRVAFKGGRFLDLDRARLWWQYDFGVIVNWQTA